jgi:hypothetical protein
MTDISGQRRAPHTGTLSGRPLAVLVADLAERGASGTLTLTSPALRAVVDLRAGRVTGVTLGSWLSDNPEVALERLFELPDHTTFAVREGDLDEESRACVSVDPFPAIWRGLVKNPPTRHLERTISRIVSSRALRLVESAFIDRLGLDDDERHVCDLLVEKPRTLGEVIAASPIGEARTRLLVYCLGLCRALEVHVLDHAGPRELGPEGVRARAAVIDQEEPYVVLGLANGASTEAVRAAFFRLARTWHPERLPLELEEVRDEVACVFSRIVLAYDRIRAAEADSWSLRPPAGVSTASMREVDEALERADFARADTLARTLTRTVVDGPNARAVLAWCEAEAGASIDRSIAALDRILAGDPQCERALYYRAKLSERLGRAGDAARDFRRLLRIAPRHEGALRDLARLGNETDQDRFSYTSGLRRLHQHLTR